VLQSPFDIAEQLYTATKVLNRQSATLGYANQLPISLLAEFIVGQPS